VRKNKFLYYFSNAITLLMPKCVYRWNRHKIIQSIDYYDQNEIYDRVNYYNKLARGFSLNENCGTKVKTFKKTKGATYFFDLRSVIRYFPCGLRFDYKNGDVTHIPDHPTFLKSRPINGCNEHSVLLKLNRIRHFNFVCDKLPYQEKKNMVVWRGVGHKDHRKRVIRAFYDHPRCDIGQTKPRQGQPWEKDFMSVAKQLQHKFVLCIEGNDVATNLKWAMSSNSLVMMSKPKFETWFMEGRLKAGVHYVELKDDYSDLIEKMDYYLEHENEALSIIHNANQWVEQFQDDNKERLISLLVADKYFSKCENNPVSTLPMLTPFAPRTLGRFFAR